MNSVLIILNINVQNDIKWSRIKNVKIITLKKFSD